ncbi:GNAT family N-acetyltransferase [Streptomyces beihaiensis]|uniref:GNAT family N-acetyltransferase n=1 Tax=Streptomyces beihaiensis TaxID=2984495 RepID=A0ABT3TZS9_9ACTN|nr:GNAT family N-acetyltransferase [Streptomyces beihaiensis]MCX3061483.1 GNAT family N-acetyltransferase [Streptomyces beihaiensis]
MVSTAGHEPITVADLRLMQDLAQRVAATWPELVNADASYGELAWNWGRGHAAEGDCWRRRLWWRGGRLVGWGWARIPYQVLRRDGVVRGVTEASLAHQVHPEHGEVVDEVIDWYEGLAAGVERTALPSAADTFGLERWTAHGFRSDPAAAGDHGGWTQLNQRELTDIEAPVLPDGFRFRSADEVGPEDVVRAHVAGWPATTYTVARYEGVRQAPGYRGDLHVLVQAPDGAMVASAVLWLDDVNRSVEFEPVGTHPGHRRRGLGRAMLLHGMRLARAAGARHATVAYLGAPGHPAARGLYYGVGFRKLSRDAPLIKSPCTAAGPEPGTEAGAGAGA